MEQRPSLLSVPSMDHFETSCQTFSVHESVPVPISVYEHDMQAYAVAQQQHAMYAMSTQPSIPVETKPRLCKKDVHTLERVFSANQKPTTQTKRGYAERMGVELNRINNWFQNRRAKQKNLIKQEQFRILQGMECPLSPSDLDFSDDFDEDVVDKDISPVQQASTIAVASRPPPAIASCNPRYANPSTASMESLQRTIAAAQAAQHPASPELDHTFLEPCAPQGTFTFPASTFPNTEYMSFPGRNEASSGFEAHALHSYSNAGNSQHLPSQRLSETYQLGHASHDPTDSKVLADPVPDVVSHDSQALVAFPSQLVLLQNRGQHLQARLDASSNTPEDIGNTPTTPAISFGVDEADDQSMPLPTSTLPRAPPSAGIASRRPKVHKKPAALGLDLDRGRPQPGPRTVSHAEGFRRPLESPMGSPMRRIVSAGGNRIGISNRVQKSGVDSAQRSPINFGNFADAGAFIEHNQHNIRTPIYSANNLAPPTPLSPNFVAGIYARGENSNQSSVDNLSYIGTEQTYFQPPQQQMGAQNQNGGQSLVSPPVTPENALGLNIPPDQEWNAAVFSENDWYGVPEVSDAPIFTPVQDSFSQLELQMPQPGYIHSLSQPVTPSLYQYPPNVFLNQEPSPLDEYNELYPHSFPSQQEYNFPESNVQYYVSPASQQKTFQFSNSTPADFCEK